MKFQKLGIIQKVGILISAGLLTAGGAGILARDQQNHKDIQTKSVQAAEREVLSSKVVKQPVVTKKTQTITEAAAFAKRTEVDGTLEKGKTKIKNVGIDGVRTKIYQVEYTDRIETSRKLVSDQVTTPPVDEVMLVGAFEPPLLTQAANPPGANCDQNYSGCVPVDSDVDCAGGRGNGPSYVRGPVSVIGSDIYGLDADDDGVGCE